MELIVVVAALIATIAEPRRLASLTARRVGVKVPEPLEGIACAFRSKRGGLSNLQGRPSAAGFRYRMAGPHVLI